MIKPQAGDNQPSYPNGIQKRGDSSSSKLVYTIDLT